MVTFMSVRIVNELKDSGLDKIDGFGSPFLSYEFFNSLVESGSIGKGSGWNPFYINDPGVSTLFTFIKEHSYGEYIFDWDWANFYHKYNISYYPKLTSMIPFTSATTPHFLGERSKEVMDTYEKFYNANDFSSSHFLFLSKDEIEFFRSYNYIIRDSFQYHFSNDNYSSFEDFLSVLKSKKAKQIKKERNFTENISFNKYTGDEITTDHAAEMYEFYLSTIGNKNAIAYLTKDFFIKIFESLRKNIYFVQAKKGNISIAGALYFYSNDTLYGRYWGAIEDISNLHFELCYYQGIDICIEKGISVFEAGAQGEHKISRGFRPVKTYSAHKFKQPEFHQAIEKYIEDERVGVEAIMTQLSERLPFKS
jgi:predicted N-acyltransferase